MFTRLFQFTKNTSDILGNNVNVNMTTTVKVYINKKTCRIYIPKRFSRLFCIERELVSNVVCIIGNNMYIGICIYIF